MRGFVIVGTLFGLVVVPARAQDPKPKEQALKKLAAELAKHVKAADADSSGTIKRSEFAAYESAVRAAGQVFLNEIDPTIAKKKAEKDLKKYDTGKDGGLNDEEKKAMEEDVRLKSIKDFDWDEDGKLNEREKQAMQWAEEGRLDGLFRRLDTEGKGEMSQERLAATLGEVSRLVKPKKQ